MAMPLPAQLHITLPIWVLELDVAGRDFSSAEAKVGFAIELSRTNVERQSGGPFGAAVFSAQHQLIAVGVNRVVRQSCSLAHAETMACMLAQQRLQQFRLNELGGPITLATSAQPCCQCYGATMWAGIDRLLIGARSEDVEALTAFDEGPLPADWIGELQKRGIEVVRDVQRDAACAVLKHYGELGGPNY